MKNFFGFYVFFILGWVIAELFKDQPNWHETLLPALIGGLVVALVVATLFTLLRMLFK